MARKVYDVVPDRSGGDLEWRVVLESAQRASGVFENKDDAVDAGRDLAKNVDLGQLRIHGQDGKFQKEYTYGKDPRKYEG